jgi:hypothetical protein
VSSAGKPQKFDLIFRELSYIYPGNDLVLDSTIIPDDKEVDGDTGNAEWPYTMQAYTKDGADITGSSKATCKPDSSPKAQNNDFKSPNAFGNHAIVMYDSKYYDPSYGKEGFASQLLYEQDMIEGFFILIPNNVSVARKKEAVEEMKFMSNTATIMNQTN